MKLYKLSIQITIHPVERIEMKKMESNGKEVADLLWKIKD